MATSSTSSASASSGVLQTLGLGSGLDISSLVSQLVTAELTPDTNRIARDTTSVATQISSLGQLKGALASFQSALSSLSGTGNFQVRTATSGDTDIFTATAGSTAVPGKYQVEVSSLAQSQQVISTVFAGDGSTAVGTGSLTIKLGGKGFTVNITDGNSSLAGIRDAINSAADNTGVTATLVHGNGNSSQLVLSSTKTGATNTIQITASTTSGSLDSLAYDDTHTTSFTQLQAAQDATVKVAGVTFNSASNTVTGAIDGVTLNLLEEKPGTPITLTVANDNTTVINRIQSFVDSYNSLRGVMNTLGNYDASTGTAGAMLGDAMLEGIATQTRRVATSVVASAIAPYNTLASIGVTTQKDGTLSLDTTKLVNVLNSNYSAVSQLFGATDGIGAQLSSFVNAQMSSTGGIATRNSTLTKRQKSIVDHQAVITARKAVLTTRYTAQFTAMDAALGKMQQTSTYLTQQFNAIAKIGNSSSNSSS